MKFMKLAFSAAAVVIGLCLSAGCEQVPVDRDAGSEALTAEYETALRRAKDAADALGADLMSTMAGEMARGGPVAAVRVCSEVAQQRSAEHSQEGLTVGRVTLKARNPLNRPDPYERSVLERFQALHEKGELPREVAEVVEQEGARVLRYLRPIQTAELCLTCHGDPGALDPQVRQVIQDRYPEDAATGYQSGDLRGAISVQAILSRRSRPSGG
jgi:hypothetical protein